MTGRKVCLGAWRGTVGKRIDHIYMADENQHWLPKLLLKKFADADGRVFRLDILTGEVSKPSPRKTASSPGFNDFEIEGEVVSFEDRLEKIETKAARPLREITEARSLAGLGPKSKHRIADFLAAQSFRTEAFFKGLKTNPSRKEFAALLEQLWDSFFVVSAHIERRYWVLMVIDSDDVFYLGDQPVVLQRPLQRNNGSSLGLDVEGVEAYMPLSPKCAFYMPCRSISQEIIARYHGAMATHRTIRTAALQGIPGGTAELLESQNTIRKSHELFQAFTKGSPIRAITPYVENLNSLQCLWAHASIYSNRKSFTFARRVFCENPQYRSTPKASVLETEVLVPVSEEN